MSSRRFPEAIVSLLGRDLRQGERRRRTHLRIRPRSCMGPTSRRSALKTRLSDGGPASPSATARTWWTSLRTCPVQLGHGFLLWDGAAEGGSRGGYWTNARKAFEFAAIGRVKPGSHLGEFFYLDKDELEEGDTGTRRAWRQLRVLARGEHDVRRHLHEALRT